MKQGRLADLVPGEFGIILGRELALVLGLRVGDKVTLVTPRITTTPAGMMPRLKRFTVRGIFEVGMGEYDRSVALLHLEDAARLLRLGDGVTGVRLKLDDMFLAPEVAREIARELPGFYRVSDWTWQHRNFFSALRTEKRMMSIILFLIVAVAAFNIVSTLVMVVTDKRSDIAILRTLGASPRSILMDVYHPGCHHRPDRHPARDRWRGGPGAEYRGDSGFGRGLVRHPVSRPGHLLHQQAALGPALGRRRPDQRQCLRADPSGDPVSGLESGPDPAGGGAAL